MKYLLLLVPLCCGCSIFKTPEMVNALAEDWSLTSAKVNDLSERLEKTLDNPHDFVSKAISGAVKGGLDGISDALEKSADNAKETSRKIEELQEADKQAIKSGAGVVASLIGVPPGPVGHGADIALGILGLHLYRNKTRKKDLGNGKNGTAKD